MIIAILIASVVGLTCVHVNGNDSGGLKIFRHITNPYLNENNHVRQLCSQNVCTQLEQETPIPSVCTLSKCIKRALQDDVGPFWANRGKKDPNYNRDTLYAEEPKWILVRRSEDHIIPITFDFEPFFVTRGKKNKKNEENDKNIIREVFTKMYIQNHHKSNLKTTKQ